MSLLPAQAIIPQQPPQLNGPPPVLNGIQNNHPHFPPPPVSLSSTIHKVVRQSYTDLLRLSRELPTKTDEERKKQLVDYLESTRERFIRLLVLVKWAHHLPNLSRTSEIINFLAQQEFFLRDAADALCHLNTKLQTARVPVYDIPTAIDVLSTGSYQRLPTMLKSMIRPPQQEASVVQKTLQQLDDHICFRLLTDNVPKQLKIVKVDEGRALCRVADEYEVVLVSNGDMKEPWQLYELKLLVSSTFESGNNSMTLNAFQIQHIMRMVQDKMATSQQPLVDMHTILHELVVRMMLEALRTQAQTFTKDTRQFEGIKYTFKDNQLFVYYWANLSVNDENAIHLRIYIDDQAQMKIEHRPPILDPTTGETALFTVSPANANLETLLLNAMHYHAYSLLHNLQKSLTIRQTNPPLVVLPLISPPFTINTTPDTITTRSEQELRVYLFAGRELRVRVNNRTGRYVVITKQLGVQPEELAARIFNNPEEIVPIAEDLRYQAVLAFIERQAHVMGLEPYRSLSLRPPTAPFNPTPLLTPLPSPKHPNPAPAFSQYTLYLWYPEVEGRFYLTVDLGQPFNPSFSLLRVAKTPPPPTVSSHQTVNPNLYNPNPQTRPDSYPINIDQPTSELLLAEDGGEEKWSTLLTSIISIGKRRKQYLDLIDQLSAEGVEYTILKDGISVNSSISKAMELSSCVLRPLQPVPNQPHTTQKTMKTGLNPNRNWSATLTERLSSVCGQTYTFYTGKGHGEIECEENSPTPTWTFTYGPSAGSRGIKMLKEDLSAIVFLRNLTTTLDQVLNGESSVSFKEKFTITSKAPTHISIIYKHNTHKAGDEEKNKDNDKDKDKDKDQMMSSIDSPKPKPKQSKQPPVPDCVVSMTWTGPNGLKLEFSPPNHTLASVLQQSLLHGVKLGHSIPPLLSNVKRFLDIIRTTYVPLFHISHFVNSGITPTGMADIDPDMALGLGLDQETCTGPYLLPADAIMVQHTVTSAALHYRNSFGIDVKMVSDNCVIIEDAASTQFPTSQPPPQHRIKIRNIPSFAQFVDDKIVPLRPPGGLGGTGVPNPGAVSHESLLPALHIVHRYMGSWWLFRQTIIAIASELEREGTQLGPLVQGLKKEVNTAKFFIKLTVGSVVYMFSVHQFERLDLSATVQPGLTEKTPIQIDTILPTHSDEATSTLSPSDTTNLSALWRRTVARPPYRAQVLTSFIRMLSLPTGVLKEIAEITVLDNVEMVLSYINKDGQHKEGLSHTPNVQEMFLVVKITSSDNPALAVEFPLRYQYGSTLSRSLRLANDQIADQTQVDLLDRQLQAAKAKFASRDPSSSRNMLYLPTVLQAMTSLIGHTPPVVSNPGFGPMT